jgi:hypothetical protein
MHALSFAAVLTKGATVGTTHCDTLDARNQWQAI